MVFVNDNWICITDNDPAYDILKVNLQFIIPSRTIKRGSRDIEIPARSTTIYYIDDKNNMNIPIGLYDILVDTYFSSSRIVDNRVPSVYDCKEYTDDIVSKIDSYKDILPGITLRSVQLLALRKIIYKKRCIVQLVTGAGKTEIMCALAKILQLETGEMPTILILEPTNRLLNDTINRFRKYGISVSSYPENRRIIDHSVNICHPMSLGNDIEKNPDLLSNVEILIGDECHHFRSDTFRRPTYNVSNLAYSIGLSASSISQDNVNTRDITKLTYDELLVIGATGPLVMNVKATTLGDKLADPVLMVFNNKANEPMSANDIANWSKISKIRLESQARSELISEISKFFSTNNRKVLILVRTKSHARDIQKILYDIGEGNRARSSYGGGYFEYYNGTDYESDTSDVFERYRNGEYMILIGTQHLIEGIDIPNLDVVVLGNVGKSEKVIIQSIGRVLRKTKTGKYGYIIDFNDSEDIVLSKHSRIRMKNYTDIIGIPNDRIFTEVNIDDLESLFRSLESI